MRNWMNLVSAPRVLYHYTSRNNRDSIFQNGLLRSHSETAELAKEQGEPNWEMAGGIFLSDAYRNPKNPAIDIWEVDTLGLPLVRDDTTDHDHLGEKWYVDWESDCIPPERLNLLSDRIMESRPSKELTEAPIADISHIGNWEKNSSFGTQDRKLLNAPKAIAKMKAMWKYPEDVDFNIMLINNVEARNWTEEGIVERDRLAQMFPKTITEIEPLIRSDQVNILYTNNKGSERVPMTGWIMAHRYGHALMRGGKSYYFKEAHEVLDRYLTDVMVGYGINSGSSQNRFSSGYAARTPMLENPITVKLAQEIFTFRAAREKNLRNSHEALHELLAQFMITGKIGINPLPRQIKWKNGYYHYKLDDQDYKQDCHNLEHDLTYELQQYFETAIHGSVGKILVM